MAQDEDARDSQPGAWPPRWELDPNQAMAAAREAARAAGDILRKMLDHVEVREKSTNDLVTDADLAAQQAIESILIDRFPDHGFLGEESARHPKKADDLWQWVVDPLDGTTNYAHGLRSFCVSIALLLKGTPVLGVIHDPMAEEVFHAIAGRGAYLDDARSQGSNPRPISPASCASLGKALVAVSFPPKISRESVEIRHFLEILLHAQSVRRLGSAALNLCYVASGRLDAYVGSRLNVWDLAAAALIAEEAGVKLARWDGTGFSAWDGQIAAAANQALLMELLEKMKFS